MAEPRRVGLDAIGWFIANSHGLLGHDKTAALIGQPPGDKADCLLCKYEAAPTAEARLAVIEALGVEPGSRDVDPAPGPHLAGCDPQRCRHPFGSHAPTCRPPS